MQHISQEAGVRRGIHRQGLSGWILARLEDIGQRRTGTQCELHIVETLALGGKRQLMLISCGDERYLVGGGPESVQCIVRVASNSTRLESDDHRESH